MMLASIVLPRPTSSARMARPLMWRSTRWATSIWWGSALIAFASSVISRSKPGTRAIRSASRRSSCQARSVGGAWSRFANASRECSSTDQTSSAGGVGRGRTVGDSGIDTQRVARGPQYTSYQLSVVSSQLVALLAPRKMPRISARRRIRPRRGLEQGPELRIHANRIALIPDRFEHLVRYAGCYSNRSRGKRRRLDTETPEIAPREVDAREASRVRSTWARLIHKVYEMDPFECPRCKGPMRVIALIDDAAVIRKILSHLGLWAPQPAPRTLIGQSAHDPPGQSKPVLTYHPVPDIA